MADENDLQARLAKMALEAKTPEQRAWAKQKLAEHFPAPPAAVAEEKQAAQQEGGKGVLDTIKEAGSSALHGAEAFANNFNKGFAFGLPGRVLDMLHAPGAPSDPAMIANEQEHPIASQLGGGTGMATSALIGPEAAAGSAAQTAVNAIPGIGRNVATRILGQAGAGALTGGVSNAAAAATNGADLRETGEAGLSGAKGGAVVGAGLGTLGEVANKIFSAIRGSKGGQARELIERYGGEVGPTTSGRGGAFEQELKDLPANDRGIGQAGRDRAAKILNQLEDEHYQQTVLPSAEEKASIAASPAGQQMRDATPIYSDLVKLTRSERLTPSERSQVNSVLNRMDDLIRSRGSVQMSETELNDFKGMLQDLSKTGDTGAPSVAEAKLQSVANSTKQMVDQGPYADVNARTHEGINRYERQRAQLDMPRRPSGREAPEGAPETEIAKLGNALARQEQNTVTSGVRNSDRFQQFADENPQFQRDIDLPDVLRAKADLGFHASGKGHGGLINRLPPGLGLGASAALALSGHGATALGPVAAEFIARNYPAIAGRYLYGPAQTAAALFPVAQRSAPGFLPLIEQEYQAALARLRDQQGEQR